ncbi:hypothetical protein Syun_016083 [Stephania yunnanensis]|uniref:histidine kinase n=1 Tax=Stephania yunnanensis TaxID=152371 RepID=A0AAP0P4J0_9MAGN
MVSEKPAIKPRTGVVRPQSKPREIAENPGISKAQLISKTNEQGKEEETQKNVCFQEPEKAKEVRNEGETEYTPPLLVINSKIPDTPYRSAENCSKCRLDRLESSSYWLAQIKLAESANKHSISATFFRLALECIAEPIRTLRIELRRYLARHRSLSAESQWNEVAKIYGLLKDQTSGDVEIKSNVALVLVIPSLVVSVIVLVTKDVDAAARSASYYVHNGALMDVKTAGESLFHVSPTIEASLLRSSLAASRATFPGFENESQSLSEISYIRKDGFLFSYYIEGNNTFAMYSNTTFVGGIGVGAIPFDCYVQLVNNNTGELYGERYRSRSNLSIDLNWFLEAMNGTNVHASVRKGWSTETQDMLIFNAAPVDQLRKMAHYLHETGPFAIMPNKDDTVSVFLNSTGDQTRREARILCDQSNKTVRHADRKMGGAEYVFYCVPLELAGVPSVSVLLFPHNGLVSLVHSRIKLLTMLLGVMFLPLFVAVLSYIYFVLRWARRELFLTSMLVKQREATQQAERKSMNKSLAFASASHDVRSALAALGGLISLSQSEVSTNPGVLNYLNSMENLSSDLVGILNTVLDASKIEAGKMQLAVEEFDLAQAVEESVNLYYITGKEKGVDVVLDPTDGSILKYSRVRGDRGKLKQILNNLLHNATKFTSEGHISVRVKAKKPSPENPIIASNNVGVWNSFWRLFNRNNVTYQDLSAIREEKKQQNLLEFIFEVDDTGKGIPKEKWKSVFEDFVQVNETALGKGGTGLGLGIVQSLVRLMDGEIGIQDKGLGEKGTCFRFNIFLSTCNAVPASTTQESSMIESCSEHVGNILHHNFELSLISPHSESPRPDGSHVVLFLRGDERRRIVHKFLKRLGINVIAPTNSDELFFNLENVYRKWCLSHLSSSGKSDFSYLSDYSSSHDVVVVIKDGPVGTSGMDNALSLQKKTSYRNTPSFILLVIDVSSFLFNKDKFSKLCSILDDYKRDFQCAQCKVVWLYTPSPNLEFRRLVDEKLAHCEHVVTKPFHGSQLFDVLRLLPEFGGASTILQGYNAKTMETIKESTSAAGPSKELVYMKSEPGTSKSCPSTEYQLLRDGNKLLFGKKVLVADDNGISRMLTNKFLQRFGAITETCENGEEAFGLVLKALETINPKAPEASKIHPYDYIFMDCEMPIMDGYEATRRIREAEAKAPYNVHIPIIALTGHDEGHDAKAAGMDFHVTRPLTENHLLQVINLLPSKVDV